MIYKEAVINSIKDLLLKQDKTVAVAESVTAGHLQAALSVGVDASKYFQGGITVYNLGQKARHLNINPIIAEKTNCVAIQIANKMAIKVSKMFCSDYGIAVTGYASVVPECEDEGLFAFYSIAFENEIVEQGKMVAKEQHPFDVQVGYANLLIEKLFDLLKRQEATGLNNKIEEK